MSVCGEVGRSSRATTLAGGPLHPGAVLALTPGTEASRVWFAGRCREVHRALSTALALTAYSKPPAGVYELGPWGARERPPGPAPSPQRRSGEDTGQPWTVWPPGREGHLAAENRKASAPGVGWGVTAHEEGRIVRVTH